jgi:hypothetical protein
MHLFAPERPNASPGHKALLRDGSAVPIVAAEVLPDNRVRLSLMLRNHDDTHSFSFSWRACTLLVQDLPEFFERFAEDPELTLLSYLGWQVAPRPKVQAKPAAKAFTPFSGEDFL